MKRAQFLNDHIAETVQANPKSFIGLGTVPLQDPQLASREAERCMKYSWVSRFSNWLSCSTMEFVGTRTFSIF